MAGKIQTLEEKAVITPDELADMHTVLETEKKYEKEKGDTKIYITTSYNLYDIYVSFKSTYVLNHSLANVIGLLKPEVYDSLFDENDNIVFQYNSPAYKLYTNVTFKEKGVFKNANGLYNVKLYK